MPPSPQRLRHITTFTTVAISSSRRLNGFVNVTSTVSSPRRFLHLTTKGFFTF
jgi:hypothetical protein